jgi:hypothetical protein
MFCENNTFFTILKLFTFLSFIIINIIYFYTLFFITCYFFYIFTWFPGYVEDAAFSEFAFEEQRRTFEQLGFFILLYYHYYSNEFLIHVFL